MEKLRDMNHIKRNQSQTSTQLVFRFFHRVVTHESIGKVAFSILVMLETLQLINYALHPTYPNLWADSFFLLLQKALSMTDLSGLWLSTGGLGLLIFVIIGFAAFSLALIFVAKEQFRPPDDKFHYSSRLIEREEIGTIKFRYVFWLAMLTKTVLVVPYSYACAAFLNPNLYSLPGSTGTMLTIFSVLGFLSMGGICCMFISFMRDNSPFSKQPFSSAVSENEEIVLVIKVVMSVYASLRNGSVSSQNTLICVLFVMSLTLLLRNYYSKPSYYTWPQNRLFQIGPLIVLTLGVSSLFQQLVASRGSAGIYVALVLEVPLAVFTWLHVRKEHVKAILYSNYSLLTNSNQVLIYNYQCILKIIALHEKGSLIQLEGILDYHVSNCKKSAFTCACSSVRDKLLKDQSPDNEQTLWYQFVRSNLLEAREKYSTVTEIYFLLAHVEKLKMKNKYKALHNLEEASSQSTLKYDFLAYSLLRDIEKQMGQEDQQRNERNPVDINRYFIFESNFGKLKEKIEMFTESHIAFWQSLLGLASKEECSNQLKIARQIKEIRQLADQLTSINPNNIQLLSLLQSFSKLVLNSSEMEKNDSIVKKGLQRNQESLEPEKEKYGDNSASAIIVISGERKNIGVIKHCNQNIKQLSGYTIQELLGQNINVLMPEFIGNMHDDVLRNYLELSQSKFDYVERLAPIVDANNFLVLCRILTKAFPSLLNGLELVGFLQTVREHHIRHRNEPPKYVLFRSDTGMVQAMSESCLKQFSYQINQIDRKNEISSELTISTLFSNLRESQVPFGEEGVNSSVTIVNQAHPQSFQQVAVVIYQRMQIFYYGVKLRLIYFFTKQSSEQLRMNSTMKELASEINSSKEEKLPPEQIISPKQRHLNSQAQKESFLKAEPFLFKLFCHLNLAIIILAAVTSIGFAVLEILNNSDFQNCKSISELSAQTVHQVASINLLVRLTQLTAFYPGLTGSFDPNILKQLISLLQDRQFQIASLYLSLPSVTSSLQQQHSSLVTFWSITNSMAPLPTPESLDSNIFDYVTSASSFSQHNSQQVPLTLLSGQIPFSQIYQDLFRIRYTGLFEALPHKLSDLSGFQGYFHSLFAHRRSMGLLRLVLISTCLILATVLLVCFDWKIQTLVNQQVALFGFLTVAEVQYQLDKCKQFFQCFYHDSYQYKLKKAEIDAEKLSLEQKKDRYSDSKKQLNQMIEEKAGERIEKKGEHKGGSKGGNKGENKGENKSENKGENKGENKNDNKGEKQFCDISDADNLLLNEKAKKESHQEGGHKRNQMLQITNISISRFILALFVLSIGYFVLAFEIADFSSLTSCIAELRSIYANLNCQTMFHVYNLEAITDNAQFKQYPLLNETAANLYNQSYNQLQNFSIIATNLPSYFSSVCDSFGRMMSAGDAVPTIQFTLDECLSLKNGILLSGLRLSLIGQLEQWSQFKSVSNLSTLFNSRQFKESLRLQWYIQGVFNLYLADRSVAFASLISERTVTVLICLGVYLLGIGIYFGVLWKVKFNQILGKMKATKIIVGMIPVRSLVRNQQLTIAYEKYLADNME